MLENISNEQLENIILELQSHSGVPFFNSIWSQLFLIMYYHKEIDEIVNKYMQIVHSLRNNYRPNPNIKSYDW